MPARTPSCYARAVRLLAARPHFRRELERKLADRGYPGEEIAEALDRLTRQHYLDDAQVARDFVAGRLARGALGRARLRAELERKGAPEEAVESALDELVPEDDLPLARAAAAAWARGHRRGRPDALARHLQRKGFTRRAIFAVLEELGTELEPSD